MAIRGQQQIDQSNLLPQLSINSIGLLTLLQVINIKYLLAVITDMTFLKPSMPQCNVLQGPVSFKMGAIKNAWRLKQLTGISHLINHPLRLFTYELCGSVNTCSPRYFSILLYVENSICLQRKCKYANFSLCLEDCVMQFWMRPRQAKYSICCPLQG